MKERIMPTLLHLDAGDQPKNQLFRGASAFFTAR